MPLNEILVWLVWLEVAWVVIALLDLFVIAHNRKRKRS